MVSAGSIGGSPKSSNRVRRLASAQRESLSSNHNRRLIPWPNVFQPAAHERRLRGSGFFACLNSDIGFRPRISRRFREMVEFSRAGYDDALPRTIVLKDNRDRRQGHVFEWDLGGGRPSPHFLRHERNAQSVPFGGRRIGAGREAFAPASFAAQTRLLY